MTVEELMTKDVVTVSPETSLKDVAALLIKKKISGVPVVEGDEVVGVVSEGDILFKEQGHQLSDGGFFARLFFPPPPEEEAKLTARTAGDAMTSPPVTIDFYRQAAAVARLMIERGVNRLPVLRHEKLVGIITRADLVRAFTRPDQEIAREITDEIVGRAFWQPRESVQVDVKDGEVVLGGEVENEATAKGLPTAVERVPGVVSVSSMLTWRKED